MRINTIINYANTLYRIINYAYGSVLCRYADRQDAYYQYQNQQYG